VRTFRKYFYGSQVEAHDHSPARFLPVTPLPDPPSADQPATDPLVLILDRGRRLAVAPGFDVETLRRFLGALEAWP
jgi:hypothetical protein